MLAAPVALGPLGEKRPPILSGQIVDAHSLMLIGRIQAGPLLCLFLDRVDLDGQFTGRCLGADLPAGKNHADRAILDAGNHGHRGGNNRRQHGVWVILLVKVAGQRAQPLGEQLGLGGSGVGG